MSRYLQLGLLVCLGGCSVAFAQEASPPVESLPARGDLLLVVGAGGTPEFDQLFAEWAAGWQTAAVAGHLRVHAIGLTPAQPDQTDHQQLQELLTTLAAGPEQSLPVWVVCLGHGTFDGRTTKFNLRGPDVTSAELGTWLQPIRRPLALIGTHAASGPLLETVGGPQRVVITATKSAAEVNFSRFGGYLIEALQDRTADLDKDEQVSLLEGFLRASRKTREFYEGDGRLETEHPLLDDNGDGQGLRAIAFSGVHPIGEPLPGAVLDGPRAHQWQLIPSAAELELDPAVAKRRDELELEILTLKSQKSSLEEAEYFAKLEALLLQMADLLVKRTANVPLSQ